MQDGLHSFVLHIPVTYTHVLCIARSAVAATAVSALSETFQMSGRGPRPHTPPETTTTPWSPHPASSTRAPVTRVVRWQAVGLPFFPLNALPRPELISLDLHGAILGLVEAPARGGGGAEHT